MDKTERLMRKMEIQDQIVKPEVRTAITGEMYIPNHSGDHSAGILNTTPTANNDIANKKYVDDGGAGGLVVTNDGTKTTILGIAGDYLRIGDAGTTAHSLNTNDDLMVTGKLEVKGTVYFDNDAYISDAFAIDYSNASWGNFGFREIGGATVLAIFSDSSHDQSVISLGSEIGRQIIITDYNNRIQDHDHATQTNPTLYVHSATDPDTANTEWISFIHDQTDGVITTGKGSIVLTPATTVRIIGLKKVDGTTPASDGDALKWESATGRIYGG